jgi:hypothetical protein
MDVTKAADKIRVAHRLMAETQAEKTIGTKVIDLLARGERVSRSSLLTALHADEKRYGADLSGLVASAAIELIEKAVDVKR